MPHTLVTGANGFVAVHVVSACINAGHTVTGSVRTKAKGEELLEIHPEWKGKLDFVEIEDYAAEGVWDDTFKSADFDYVMHVAAPMVDNPKSTDYERDFLRPGVEGYKGPFDQAWHTLTGSLLGISSCFNQRTSTGRMSRRSRSRVPSTPSQPETPRT
jgi:nucleoside-diphosphate-sugar epimerase